MRGETDGEDGRPKKVARRIEIVGETGRHNLYGLLDAEAGTIFYVGVSSRPSRRIYQHYMNGESGAFRRCTELMISGKDVKMVILASFDDREAAKHVERRLVQEYPGLVNRKFNVARRGLPRNRQANMPRELGGSGWVGQ